MKLTRSERDERLKQLLEDLNLTHLADRQAHKLSGGERRRVEITRALVRRPSFMLLDEPFVGIDPIAVSEIQDIVTRLRENGLGVLITDHNVRETLRITDRAYIMYEGRILLQGSAESSPAIPRRVRSTSAIASPFERERVAMEMKHSLHLTQKPALIMTQRLQQALKLLQVPTLELQQILKQEIMQNPLLEEVDDVTESEDLAKEDSRRKTRTRKPTSRAKRIRSTGRSTCRTVARSHLRAGERDEHRVPRDACPSRARRWPRACSSSSTSSSCPRTT
jgi:ABC-type multidrug transport system ATPase subunit